ncbi:hypothetical protein SPI_09114 [Niveomyces insectorum RCEF 264]|uniref:Uncharacterized protein n=1 Tax=Niveomyces insectorum RCEF 264 TaxID=1081102 RepID=A0A167M4C1_9HYPO|nr:hypothetical protein SPI_09114 [Niveomyces insectorum RCEF 264]
MKSNFLAIAALAFAAVSGAAATPASLPMGIEVTEQNGTTVVREVSHESLGLEKRCRECKHTGEGCTIGDGSCYAREHASCTWCGNHCKSICIPDGDSCAKWCL